MAETKKITKREVITSMLANEVITSNPTYVTYLENELALLDKKKASGKGVSKTQIENKEICKMLLAELEKIGKPVTISDLMASSEVIRNYTLENGNPITNQKISALFKLMGIDGTNEVVKVVDKKKSYFSVNQDSVPVK